MEATKTMPQESRLERSFNRERRIIQIVATTPPTFAVFYDSERDDLWSTEVLCWALREDAHPGRDADSEGWIERCVAGLVEHDDLFFVDEACESDWSEFLGYSKNSEVNRENFKEEIEHRRKAFCRAKEGVGN
jgi:hypothetical protein